MSEHAGGCTPAPDGIVDCREALDRLFEFLDAEIDDAGGDKIRAHLAYCEPCLAEFDIEDHVKKLVRRSCSKDVAPEDLRIRIREQLTLLRVELG